MPEQPPSPEPEFSPEELRLVELFRARGPEDSEAQELYRAWFDREQRIADEKADRGEEKTANVEFQLKTGALKEAAGFLNAAIEDYNDALYMANQNGAPDDLRDRIAAALARAEGR